MIMHLAPFVPQIAMQGMRDIPSRVASVHPHHVAYRLHNIQYTTQNEELDIFPSPATTPQYAEIVCTDDWVVHPEDFCVQKSAKLIQDIPSDLQYYVNFNMLCIWFCFFFQLFYLIEQMSNR